MASALAGSCVLGYICSTIVLIASGTSLNSPFIVDFCRLLFLSALLLVQSLVLFCIFFFGAFENFPIQKHQLNVFYMQCADACQTFTHNAKHIRLSFKR